MKESEKGNKNKKKPIKKKCKRKIKGKMKITFLKKLKKI